MMTIQRILLWDFRCTTITGHKRKSFVLKTETTSSEKGKSYTGYTSAKKIETVHTSADLGHVHIIA
jgi:hypothetical protein